MIKYILCVLNNEIKIIIMRSQSLKLFWPHLHILVHVPKYLPGKVIATNGVALSEGVVNTQCATQYPTIAR